MAILITADVYNYIYYQMDKHADIRTDIDMFTSAALYATQCRFSTKNSSPCPKFSDAVDTVAIAIDHFLNCSQ